MSAIDILMSAAGIGQVGQAEFTTPGTYSWTVPAGVTSVCAVCVGAGGFADPYGPSGGGGALAYANDISVTPGSSITVVVGAVGSSYTSKGGNSRFSSGVCEAGGGESSETGSPFGAGGVVIYGTGGAGGNGGASYFASSAAYATGGGGGAGGYSGAGGDGSGGVNSNISPSPPDDGGAGTGGAGGGGSGASLTSGVQLAGGIGGGVGILGQGSSGAGGPSNGGGNKNGIAGGDGSSGTYGRGSSLNANGTGGAVRIIWGVGRAFPSTNTGNL